MTLRLVNVHPVEAFHVEGEPLLGTKGSRSRWGVRGGHPPSVIGKGDEAGAGTTGAGKGSRGEVEVKRCLRTSAGRSTSRHDNSAEAKVAASATGTPRRPMRPSQVNHT